MTRREMLRHGIAGAMSLAFWAARPNAALGADGGDLLVVTMLGPVRGQLRGGLRDFSGIPVAATNAGIHRFVAPRAIVPWTDELDLESVNALPENDLRLDAARFDEPLRISVFAPLPTESPKRVLVAVQDWAYPQAQLGPPSRQSPELDPAAILVRIDHRRGAFGFTYLGGLLAREFSGSGNAGLLDIVHGLVWIRDNIAAFGGDPGNVTLTGGNCVGCVAALPAARGLYRKAMSIALPRIATPEAADRATASLLKVLGLAPAKARSLQQVPSAELQAAWDEARAALPPDAAFGPVADDIVLPRAVIPAAQLIG